MNEQELKNLKLYGKKRPRAGPYARASSREQEKQQTIDIQTKMLGEAVEERGWELLEFYKDDGYSGELLERPGIDRLLDEIEEKKLDVVPITEPDRLAREFFVQKLLEQEIKERGATVVYLSLPPPTNEDEELGHDVRGVVSAWERRKIKQRTFRGKIKKAKEGFIVGGKSPYGFRYVPRTHNDKGHYEPIEDEFRWVEKMFEWCASEHLSVDAIALRLTNMKVPTQTGNRMWRGSTVHHILTNQTHAGTAHYLKRRSIPPKDWDRSMGYRRLKNTSREMRPKEEWIPIPLDLTIDRKVFIGRETWDRAQLQLKRNAKESSRNTRHPYLLRGKTFCGLCGLPCYGCVSRSKLRYQCSDRHYRSPLPKNCPARSIDASTVESLVWELLSGALAHRDVFLGQLKELQKDEAERTDCQIQEIERLKKRTERLKKQEARAAELYMRDEQMSINQYDEHVARIRDEVANAQREIRDLEERKAKKVDWERASTNMKFLDAYINAKIGKLGFEDKRRIVDLLVDKVFIYEDRVRIEGAVPSLECTNLGSSGNAARIASHSSPSGVQIRTNW